MSSYTVKQVARLSGVSIRTLHHYDEVGLLKPACVGANSYRYYGRDELLRLQQILFHRELGFPLEEIRQVLDAPGFDRAERLIATIDTTLAALQGATTPSTVGPDRPRRYRDLGWSEFRRRRADGDFADYGAEVQISDWRIG